MDNKVLSKNIDTPEEEKKCCECCKKLEVLIKNNKNLNKLINSLQTKIIKIQNELDELKIANYDSIDEYFTK